MTYDQPHDDSEQMMRMHYGDDDSSAAYDAEMERQTPEQKAFADWLFDPKAPACATCGGPLPSERDQETGTCKPCRVTEGM